MVHALTVEFDLSKIVLQTFAELSDHLPQSPRTSDPAGASSLDLFHLSSFWFLPYPITLSVLSSWQDVRIRE